MISDILANLNLKDIIFIGLNMHNKYVYYKFNYYLVSIILEDNMLFKIHFNKIIYII